jgi:hypothetical protein
MQLQPPPGLHVAQAEGTLVIRHRWFRGPEAALAFGVALGLLGLVSWVFYLLVDASNAGQPVPLVVFGLLGLLWLPGLYRLYVALRLVFNQTVIKAQASGLEMASGPLPPFGRAKVARPDLGQLFVERQAQGVGTVPYLYRVHAATKDKHLVEVIVLPQIEKARYIERAIEMHLGITDSPVQGEYRE